MKQRFYNAKILTMCDGQPIFEGELHTDNERITFVGDSAAAARAAHGVHFERERDCGGNLLLPGFKNTHTHSAMTALRSLADDLPLANWLEQTIFPFEAKMSHEDMFVFTKLAGLEYLTSGITAVGEMYRDAALHTAQAFAELGINCTQVGAINNFLGSVEDMRADFERINGADAYNRYYIGLHAQYTTSLELIKQTAALARELHSPVYCHNSETEREVAQCIAEQGMTPTELFDSVGAFEYGGGGYHCVWLSEKDMDIFARRGLFAVTCPASNLKLASGIAPICEYIDHGLRVAIGTDSAASNNSLDMFREMYLVSTLQKVRCNNAAAMPARQVLKMATVNGAHCLGLPDADALAAGKLADFIELDLMQPNMQPVNNLEASVVYSAGRSNVKMTVIHGKILYDGGVFYTADQPQELYERAERIMTRLR